jgi:hypothetical protein
MFGFDAVAEVLSTTSASSDNFTSALEDNILTRYEPVSLSGSSSIVPVFPISVG